MNKTYLILAHHLPHQLWRLINSLDDGESRFLIHLDKRSEFNQFTPPGMPSHRSVQFLENRKSCYWGDYSIVEAMLELMTAFITNPQSDDYAILLSGQDYPIAPPEYINSFLSSKKGTWFQSARPIQGVWSEVEVAKRIEFYRFNLGPEKYDSAHIPAIGSPYLQDKRWFHELKKLINDDRLDLAAKNKALALISKPRNTPKYPIYGGSQWFAYPTDAIEKILRLLNQDPSHVDFHRNSHVPDELFLPTLTKAIQSQNPKIRIEKTLTYVDWSRKDQPRPATFCSEDFDLLKGAAKDFLFARKFDPLKSADLLDMIDHFRSKH